MTSDRQRWRRDEARAQRRAGQRVDQGACPHVGPGDLACSDCFFGGES